MLCMIYNGGGGEYIKKKGERERESKRDGKG
jgi:hypothetical protein